jgi:hypothetical protein
VHRNAHRLFVALLIGCATWGATVARAAEVTVQNDRLADGGTAAIQAGFVAGETAAAWLTSPCTGRIVAVQVFWRSTTGTAGVEIHDSITVRAAGAFPTPGAPLLSNGAPTELIGPAMQDGGLNEFRFMDKNNLIPIDVPVTQGQVFVVTFTFAENPGPQGPSLATDINGCQNGKNSIDEISFGWFNLCFFGVSGDLVIRAVVDCDEVGACCLPTGVCLSNTSPGNCQNEGGTYQGQGSSCAQANCPQPGACCFPEGECQSPLTESACTTQGGTFHGAGSTCGTVNCPQPLGACCFGPESCVNLTEGNCAIARGVWGGAFTNCNTFNCFPEGACCMPGGSCFFDSPDECATAGGTYQGDDVLCASVECPLPFGACCLGNGACLHIPELDCSGIPNATWAGAFTTCVDADLSGTADDCESPQPECLGDVVSSRTFQPPPDGKVDGADLAFLLGEWGPNPGSPADVVNNTTFAPPPDGVVDGADLAVFLGAWGPCD